MDEDYGIMKIFYINGDSREIYCSKDDEAVYGTIKDIMEAEGNMVIAIKWNGVFISDEIIKSYI